jgi:F-type H+-transporting ATPase subunit alpha
MATLTDEVRRRLRTARQRLERVQARPQIAEVGIVEHLGDGVATISGLSNASLEELLLLPGDARALAISLERDRIGAVLLDPDVGIAAGDPVFGTGAVVRVPVGEALLGRVVDPLGRPRDGGPEIETTTLEPIHRPAPGIVDRELVTEPLHTGILAIDAMIPLGRGQRELIIGDRRTGKTAIAVDAIINQRRSDVICVYAAVGQRASTVGRVIETVRQFGPFERCIFVVAGGDDPPGQQWIAPYAACTMAEYFRDRGGHALLVVDDLTKHAIVHRQISLLLRYPPGREAYPGDIFYVHARFLERAAKLSEEGGGGSLTALPIAETQSSNMSAYIPTNLISITDGQIYLEPKLFNEGHKPAIDVGKSVSRVGGKTQAVPIKELAETLRLDYAQFIELEMFTRFGQMADERTRTIIDHGRRVRTLLQQPQSQPLALATQVALLLALQENVLDGLPLEAAEAFKSGLEEALATECRGVVERLEANGRFGDGDRGTLLAWLRKRAEPLSRADDGEGQ